MVRVFLSSVILATVLWCLDSSAQSADIQTTELVGKTWTLVSLQDLDVSAKPAVTVRFEEDGRLSGANGCTSYEATYAITDGVLEISGELGDVQLGCPEAFMSRANAYGVALGRTTAFAIDGGRLSLRDSADAETASFEPYSQILSANAWHVTAYSNSQNAMVDVLDGTQMTMNFGDEGRLTGSAGCNNFFADYEAGDETVTIAAAGTTRKMCADPTGIMEQETLFLAALASAAEFRLIGNILTIRRADSELVLTMAVATDETAVPTVDEDLGDQLLELEPLTEELTAQFDLRVAEMKVNSEDFMILKVRVDLSEGLAGDVFSARLDRLWTSNLKGVLSLTRDVMAQKEDGKDVSAYWNILQAVLNEVPSQAYDAMQRVRGRVNFPETDLEPADFVVEDQILFREMAEVDEIYATFISYLEVADSLGIDAAEEREFMVETLTDSAANRSVFLEMAQNDVNTLRSSVATLPDNADLTAWLSAADARVSNTANSMQSVINLMSALDIESRQYRQQVLTVTGEITTDVLDVGIFTNLVSEWSSALLKLLAEDGMTLLFRSLLVLFVIFVFVKIANLVQKVVDRALGSSRFRISNLLRRMIVMSVRNFVIVIGILIAISQMGISLAPLLAGLGILGFIVGFALQDSLANFASGMLILLYRPFDVGDVVEAGGVSGKVSHMSLVNTTFMTFDNKRLVVPNNMIWGSVITNLTAQLTRRVDLVFGISYQDDIERAESVFRDVVNAHELVLDTPEPLIKVHELADSSVNMIVRPWVKTDDYWDVYWDLMKAIKLRLDKEGISIPFPQRDVHMIGSDST
jgi:small conductance mechanosensitive channel